MTGPLFSPGIKEIRLTLLFVLLGRSSFFLAVQSKHNKGGTQSHKKKQKQAIVRLKREERKSNLTLSPTRRLPH
jgi:hypothetical protein